MWIRKKGKRTSNLSNAHSSLKQSTIFPIEAKLPILKIIKRKYKDFKKEGKKSSSSKRPTKISAESNIEKRDPLRLSKEKNLASYCRSK
jgi:hypothetical protein